MVKHMNILVIPTWYPSGKDKLMGNYHKEFCEALSAKKEAHVNMLFIERERLNNPLKYIFMPKRDVIKENGYKTYIKRMLNVEPISFDWQLKRYVKVLDKAFRRYLKENPKPDIIHAMVTLPAGYAACKIGEKYKIPVVVTEHSSYFKRFFEGKNKEYGAYVLKHSQFTTVSNFMAQDMKKYTDDCEVLPNVVNTDIFKTQRKKIKGLKLITVSALRQGKRIDDIFAALKIIVEENQNLEPKLTVVGDGFLESYYKEKCHELGMDDYVDFVGRKTKEEIAEILPNHNIFVIASEKETFCIPGVEALASGLPVVSTKCLGPEEYITEACGKLVSVGNTKELANAIMAVYNHLEDYDAKNLRKVAERYSRKNVINQALNIYKKLLK